MNATVLIIDDEDLFREDLASLLGARGYACVTAGTAAEGMEAAAQHAPDVVLCDIVLPDRGGIEVLDDLIRLDREAAVIMITAYGSLETAVQSFRKGAMDYVLKPLVIDDVVQKIDRVMRSRALTREVRRLRSELARAAGGRSMVARSRAMQRVQELVARVAEARSTVLITGETGTGKEVVARAIHARSAMADGPFVPVNCAAMPEELMESELFGHERGAYTGADRAQAGYFEQADRGTLFLDEITEMRPDLQSKLLRAIEEKSVRRLGSAVPRATDVHIVAASNRDVPAEVAAGRLRQDLYYRLAVVEIAVPALRERPEDIEPLVSHFLDRYSVDLKRPRRSFSAAAMQALMAHDWPGNVRELENAVERAVILARGDTLELDDLPPAVASRAVVDGSPVAQAAGGAARTAAPPTSRAADDLRDAVRAFERAYVERILREAGGNREEAAHRMGISPSTLYRKMADLGLAAARGAPGAQQAIGTRRPGGAPA